MKRKKLISNLLVATISICCWEVGQQQVGYIQGYRTYSTIQEQKEDADDTQAYLKEHNFDWIQVTGTSINYPLMTASNNNYYLNHDFRGESSINGSIYYNANDVPYNGSNTVIYGHSMRDGSMFNNLHFFQKDSKMFDDSTLIIETKNSKTEYKPLGYYVTNDNFVYKDIDDLPVDEAIKVIEQNADYFIQGRNISTDSHIIALYTCDYSIEDGRLIVWYIKE